MEDKDYLNLKKCQSESNQLDSKAYLNLHCQFESKAYLHLNGE